MEWSAPPAEAGSTDDPATPGEPPLHWRHQSCWGRPQQYLYRTYISSRKLAEEVEQEAEEAEPGILVTHRVKLHPVYAAAAAGIPPSDLTRLLATSVSHGQSVATGQACRTATRCAGKLRAGAILSRLQQADLPTTWAKAARTAAHCKAS